ncbi:MAG: AI-2E family transporter [Gemmatimonadales bacterium]
MPFLDSNHQRAALVLFVLGIALVVAFVPFATGLVGIPVLYVVFEPVHRWLTRRISPRFAAAIVVLLALFLIVVPGVSFAGLIVAQAQEIAGGVVQSPLLDRLSRLQIRNFDIGAQLAGLGGKLVTWIGTSAFGLIGTATRLALNLTIALFGLYYLLLRPGETWRAVRPYIPFSAENTELLRQRFRNVTVSTVVGTGLVAAIQGIMVGLGFWAAGLSNALFWGVVTVVLAILPVVGSALVWGPGVIALAIGGQVGWAIALALWGILAVGNVDYIVRPIVFRRWANIHPIVTLLGALAGVPYFGILGLLIGPLALSYFFELIGMYREEYLRDA